MIEPLTPPDCDLTGYDFMPLFGNKLFRSKWYAMALKNPRAALAGQKLWWEAWLQIPAASLPNDDDELARLADFGTDLKGWAKVKEIALHGFVLCSDGRLYHQFQAPEAIKAYEARLQKDTSRNRDRERLRQWRLKRSEKGIPRGGGNPSGNGHETRFNERFETPDETPLETAVETADETRHANVSKRVGQYRDSTGTKEVSESARERAHTRAHRLPENWGLGQAEREFAMGLGLDPNAMAASFADHYRAASGQNSTKRDWSAAFRNWCRNELKFHGRRQRSLSPANDATMAILRTGGFDPREESETGDLLWRN